ncbi:AAA family ATPase [Halosimplex rubrum]|uniref:AAA family ATPase n=1 Tax=Halosimplex rubrum TaxID=869889 RepID=A0A7D5SZU7_9EURY|nr:AAA family ATPase [Halosimplex rubrum]QLH77428.1 AAA family ATPase [Halosimplex rubrum]
MIRSPRALNHNEVPDQELIVYRGHHLSDVEQAVQDLIHGRAADPFILHGPPGTGKTMVARHTLRRYDSRDDVVTAYVDCWRDYDEYHLLSDVVDELSLRVVHENSTPQSTLVDALQAETDRSRVVVLDELEMVQDPAPLDALAAAPNLTVVGIVNDRDELDDTVGAVWGQLGESRYLQFGDYSVTQLTRILARRAEHALAGTPLSDLQIEHIAEAADGDARLGICILRAAAEHAYEGDAESITDGHIASAVETASRELHEETLARLTHHQRTLYEVVRDAGEISPAGAHDRYADRVADPRSSKTASNYLRKMVSYGLLVAEGATRGKTYRIDDSGYAAPGFP